MVSEDRSANDAESPPQWLGVIDDDLACLWVAMVGITALWALGLYLAFSGAFFQAARRAEAY